MIEIKDLSKSFGRNLVIAHAGHLFHNGSVTLITGRNGSGKTVLLKLMCGLMKPTSGTVLMNHMNLKDSKELPDSCGVIIETPYFWNEKTGLETLQFLASFQKKAGMDEILEALKKTGLYDARNISVRKYSLGMKQRLALAQAVMEDQNILLLDEPTNSLDKDGVQMFQSLMQEEKAKGKTIVIASHNEEDILPVCDEHLNLEEGKLQQL